MGNKFDTQEILAWEKIRFSSDSRLDMVADFICELEALTTLDRSQAEKAINWMLQQSHASSDNIQGDGFSALHCFSESRAKQRILENLITHITQSARIPHMTKRLDVVGNLLDGELDKMRVIDYGGGGGKDSIFYARGGASVVYCDILGELTPYVRKRFDLRGLDIDIVDVRDLPDERVDLINCMDVIEHVYDIEYVVADVLSRLSLGGILACWPAFTPDWTGDHLEKNAAYKEYFVRLLQSAGMELLLRGDSILVFRRSRPTHDSPSAERETIRQELYLRTRRYAIVSAAQALALLPIYLLVGILPFIGARNRLEIFDMGVGRLCDNLCVWRLASRRVCERQDSSFGRLAYGIGLVHQLAWYEGRKYKSRRFFELRRGMADKL